MTTGRSGSAQIQVWDLWSAKQRAPESSVCPPKNTSVRWRLRA
eukprot:CAMPEP_0204207252 /NCGR_PEP_ID=MMETSP0361-20130328/71634_1 /ASSEMBLY_ACC=CAM_ASM_000343 /TAXON_ID=268821 /ORGANISM="Scrippsiella Hangoei, Strain SHTV-5" /LENGTH=42 /DNA_ID= /DNA_START= /DNA_END= /DNA_ORIENTATION=